MPTARFSLPLLQVGQSQKELTHNEGLQALETFTQSIVEAGPRNAPPATPQIGQQFIVGVAGSGDFAGRANNIATWTEAGWIFCEPREGMTATERLSGMPVRYGNGAWSVGSLNAAEIQIDGVKVLGPRGGAISAPSGGSTVDVEARACLQSMLNALRSHGIIAT